MHVGTLLAALLLAGCASLEPPAAEDALQTARWGIEGCAFVIVEVPVDPARLEPLLPEGFALPADPLSPLPAGPRARLSFDAYRCATGVAANASMEDVPYGSHYVAAIPPAELAQEGYDAVFVKWDPLVADATLRARLKEAGMEAHDGDARVQIDGAQVTASLAFEEGGGFTFTGLASGSDPQDAPLPFMEYTPLGEGALARWHARLHDARIASGAGVIQVQTPWAREVIGSDQASATFIAGAWNLDEADVSWPIAWPR